VHYALAVSSTFTTTFTSYHGHITAVMGADHTSLGGTQSSSDPFHLHLAFPAILSHKGGLSRNVMTQLHVGNQHKMGPRGVRSLLIEMHTMQCQAQIMFGVKFTSCLTLALTHIYYKHHPYHLSPSHLPTTLVTQTLKMSGHYQDSP